MKSDIQLLNEWDKRVRNNEIRNTLLQFKGERLQNI